MSHYVRGLFLGLMVLAMPALGSTETVIDFEPDGGTPYDLEAAGWSIDGCMDPLNPLVEVTTDPDDASNQALVIETDPTWENLGDLYILSPAFDSQERDIERFTIDLTVSDMATPFYIHILDPADGHVTASLEVRHLYAYVSTRAYGPFVAYLNPGTSGLSYYYTFTTTGDDFVHQWEPGVPMQIGIELINSRSTPAVNYYMKNDTQGWDPVTDPLFNRYKYMINYDYIDQLGNYPAEGGGDRYVAFSTPNTGEMTVTIDNVKYEWYYDCDEDGYVDSGEIISTTVDADCDGDGDPDTCEIADDATLDNDGDGYLDTCADCNANLIPDLEDIADGTELDCNGNNIPDSCDLSSQTSDDCDLNNVPDECQPDCNNNSVADVCDIANSTSLDIDSDGTPDECETDCDSDTLPDDYEIAQDSTLDTNDNGILDACEEVDVQYEPAGMHVPAAAEKFEEPITGQWDVEQHNSYSVHLSNGEMFYEVEDVRIPGRGFDFVWTRTYRSRTGSQTDMGWNWDHSYNIYVELAANSTDLILHDGTGRADTYTDADNDGVFTCPGFFRTIERMTDPRDESSTTYYYVVTFVHFDRWLLKDLTGSASDDGKIEAIVDKYGNEMDFNYTNGLLTSIEDTLYGESSYRVINIGYDASNRVTSVSDWGPLGTANSRTVSYAYDANGDLTAVVYPDPDTGGSSSDGSTGIAWEYTYTTATATELELQHNLSSVRDGKGQLFLAVEYYDDEVTLLPGDIEYDRVAYQDVGDVYGGRYVYEYQGYSTSDCDNHFASTRTIVNDPVGNVEELLYDEAGHLLVRREYTGRANPTSTLLDDANYDGTLESVLSEPVRTGDPDYFESEYLWNDESRLTMYSTAGGTIHTYEYQWWDEYRPSQGNLLKHTIRKWEDSSKLRDKSGDMTEVSEAYSYADGSYGKYNIADGYTNPDGINQGISVSCGDTGCTGYPSNISIDCNIYVVPADKRSSSSDKLVQMLKLDSDSIEALEEYSRSDCSRSPCGELIYDEYGRISKIVRGCSTDMITDIYEYTINDVDVGQLTRYTKDAFVEGNDDCEELLTQYEYDKIGGLVSETSPRGDVISYDRDFLGRIQCEYHVEYNEPSTTGDHICYEYDDNGNKTTREVQSETDTSDFSKIDFTYDYMDRLVRKTHFRDGSTGEVITEYDYDDNGNLIEAKFGEAANGNQADNRVVYSYDERDLLFVKTEAPGNSNELQSQYDHDGDANRIKVTRGSNLSISLQQEFSCERNILGRIVETTNPEGTSTSYESFFDGTPLSITVTGDPGDGTSKILKKREYSYDSHLRNTQIDDYAFTLGDIVDASTPVMSVEKVYNDLNQIVGYKNSTGGYTKVDYDGADRIEKIYRYENSTAVEDDLRETLELYYDKNSNVTEIRRYEHYGESTLRYQYRKGYQYDSEGRVTYEADLIYGYPEFVATNIRTYEYDSRGNLIKIIDGKGNETRRSYDGLNRLLAVVRDLNEGGVGTGTKLDEVETRYFWDDSSRLIGIQDDKGNSTEYDYNSRNNRTRLAYADGSTYAFWFNALGYMTQSVDPNGSQMIHSHDKMGRVTGRTINRAFHVLGTTSESFAYDALGHVLEATNYDGASQIAKVEMLWNSVDQLISEKQYHGSSTTPFTVEREYGYDFGGPGNKLDVRLKYDGSSITDHGFGDYNGVIRYDRDYIGRLRTIDNNLNATSLDYYAWGSYLYKGAKHVVRRETQGFSGGTVIRTVSYNNACLVSRIYNSYAGVNNNTGFLYDANYNKSARIEYDPASSAPFTVLKQRNYSYDSLNRLVRTDIVDGSGTPIQDPIQYTLDKLGNRINVTGLNPTADQYTAIPEDALVNQYTSTPTGWQRHDANGNLIRMASTLSDVDRDGDLDQADYEALYAVFAGWNEGYTDENSWNADLNADGMVDVLDYAVFMEAWNQDEIGADLSISLEYDFRDRLIRFYDPVNNLTVTYAYDATGRRIAKEINNGSNITTDEFFYDKWQVIKETVDGQEHQFIYGREIDEPLIMRVMPTTAGGTPTDYVYIQDDQFNSMAMLNSVTGSVAETYEYDDYGKVTIFNASGTPIEFSAAIGNPYIFTGRRYDAETGFYYYRNRYYDPDTGRFLTRDPLGYADGMNLYEYVRSNPSTLVDPMGLWGIFGSDDDDSNQNDKSNSNDNDNSTESGKSGGGGASGGWDDDSEDNENDQSNDNSSGDSQDKGNNQNNDEEQKQDNSEDGSDAAGGVAGGAAAGGMNSYPRLKPGDKLPPQANGKVHVPDTVDPTKPTGTKWSGTNQQWEKFNPPPKPSRWARFCSRVSRLLRVIPLVMVPSHTCPGCGNLVADGMSCPCKMESTCAAFPDDPCCYSSRYYDGYDDGFEDDGL